MRREKEALNKNASPRPAEPDAQDTPAGLKPFVPPPLHSRDEVQDGAPRLACPSAERAALCGLTAFLAWICAWIGVIWATGAFVQRLWLLIPELVAGIVPDALAHLQIDAEIFSGVTALWAVIREAFGAVRGSTPLFMLGLLLLATVLIPLVMFLAAMRTNPRAAYILVIVNLLLCIAGGNLCRIAISRVTNALYASLSPGGSAFVMIHWALAACAVLWAACAIVFSRAGSDVVMENE